MESPRSAPPQSPTRWCQRVLSRLPEQAGIVPDGDTIAELLTMLVAEPSADEDFLLLLETLANDARPQVALAAVRIRNAWQRELSAANGATAEPKPRALVV